MQHLSSQRNVLIMMLGTVLWLLGATWASASTSPFPTLPLATIPLISVQYGAPQILFVLDNSQSMDGNLAGAIMTGSGTVSTSVCTEPDGWWGCQNTTTKSVNEHTSSPSDFTVPSGFVPPVTGGSPGTREPYTSDSNGTLVEIGRAHV